MKLLRSPGPSRDTMTKRQKVARASTASSSPPIDTLNPARRPQGKTNGNNVGTQSGESTGQCHQGILKLQPAWVSRPGMAIAATQFLDDNATKLEARTNAHLGAPRRGIVDQPALGEEGYDELSEDC